MQSDLVSRLLSSIGLDAPVWLQQLMAQRRRATVSAHVRRRLYKAIASLSDVDVKPFDAVHRLLPIETRDGTAPNRPPAIALQEWADAMRRQNAGGSTRREISFADALQGWAPPEEIMLIAAYEKTGNTGDGLREAASMSNDVSKIVQSLLLAMMYPCFIVGTVFYIVIDMTLSIVPQINRMLPNMKFSGEAATFLNFAKGLTYGLAPGLVAILAFCIAVAWSLPRLTGRARIVLDEFPPYSFYRIITSARFLLTLVALRRIPNSSDNNILRELYERASPWLQERIAAIQAEMGKGWKLGEAAWRAGYDFPDRESLDQMRTYSDLPQFDKAIEDVARQMMERARWEADKQAKILMVIGLVLPSFLIVKVMSGFSALLDAATKTGGF